ncbi:MAG: M28 family peptidase [Gammaproteobacteria bacterium]
MGHGKAREIILIGAHYDSVRGSPGANDNASGVAALLELSRLFAELKPDRTVRFVAFVNEEPPFFYRRQMGSMVYTEAARERDDDIRLMMSLEMLGSYSDRPGSQRYPPLFRYFYPDRGRVAGLALRPAAGAGGRRARPRRVCGADGQTVALEVTPFQGASGRAQAMVHDRDRLTRE